MRYWSVFFLYIVFVFFVSYYSFAQECGSDKPVITGAACSIKDLPKTDEKGEIIKPFKEQIKKDFQQKKKDKSPKNKVKPSIFSE